MDAHSRFDDLDEAVQAIVEAKLAETHTSIPFVVVSTDFSKKPPTCVVQPTVKARVRKPDGSQEWMDLPQVPDVPIHFPSGGGATLTFPVKAGDEGMLYFSKSSIDAYQQQGGEQQQVDIRPHDISNAYASIGVRTSKSALDSVSTESTQLRSDDGQTLLDMKGGEISLSASGMKVKVTPGRVDLGGDGGVPVMTESGPSSKVFAVV